MANMSDIDIAPPAEPSVAKTSQSDKYRVGFPWALVGIILLFFIISIVGVLQIVASARSEIAGFSLELIKALLQLGVVAGAGTVTSLLVNNYQRRRQKFDEQQEFERQEERKDQELKRQEEKEAREKSLSAIAYRNEVLKGAMARLVATYNSVKKARRTLRAQGIVGSMDKVSGPAGAQVKLGIYETNIEAINEDQLEVEALLREINASPDIFGEESEIEKKLYTMEGYLSALIREYEETPTRDYGSQIPLIQLPVLTEFLSRRKTTGPKQEKIGRKFARDFSDPLQDIQNWVRSELRPTSLVPKG